MIEMHHKLFPYRGEAESLVEGFRRADLCDLSAGIFRFDAAPDFLAALERTFPDEGFRSGITKRVCGWALTHPRRPFPMLRL